MPLERGTSKATFRRNMAEMMDTYHDRGGQVKFGAHSPLRKIGKEKALQIALARAYQAKR